MVILYGYVIDTQDISSVELVINEMQQITERACRRQYRHLLEKEIETVTDDIVLGIIQRPHDATIYEIAKTQLNNRIGYATSRKNPTEYNMQVAAHVLFHEEKTYIKLDTANKKIAERIAKIKDVKALFVSDSVVNGVEDENGVIWNEVVSKYKRGVKPMGVQLFPGPDVEPNPDQLKFRSPAERAEERARHNITNRLLSMYAGEQQIPPHRLMQYLDMSLMRLTEEEITNEIMTGKTQLTTTLPNITTVLISSLPGEEGEKNAKEIEMATEN